MFIDMHRSDIDKRNNIADEEVEQFYHPHKVHEAIIYVHNLHSGKMGQVPYATHSDTKKMMRRMGTIHLTCRIWNSFEANLRRNQPDMIV